MRTKEESREDWERRLRSLSDSDLASEIERECCPPLIAEDVAGIVLQRAICEQIARGGELRGPEIAEPQVLALHRVEEAVPGLLSHLAETVIEPEVAAGRSHPRSSASRIRHLALSSSDLIPDSQCERRLILVSEGFVSWRIRIRSREDERGVVAEGVARMAGGAIYHGGRGQEIEAAKMAVRRLNAYHAKRRRRSIITVEDVLQEPFALTSPLPKLAYCRDGVFLLSAKALRDLFRTRRSATEPSPTHGTEAGQHDAATCGDPLEALEVLEAAAAIKAAVEARRALATGSQATALVRENALALLRGELSIRALARRSGLARRGLDQAWAVEREALARAVE